VTSHDLHAIEGLAINLARAAHEASIDAARGASIAGTLEVMRGVIGGLAATVGIAQESRSAIDKLSRIAIEWIALGIPDDDAQNALGAVNDIRAEFKLPPIEEA
jgi:hypothetical protein